MKTRTAFYVIIREVLLNMSQGKASYPGNVEPEEKEGREEHMTEP